MEIIYIALLTFIASSVSTFTGFGLSTIMIPVLTLFLPFSQVLLLVGLIHWLADIWKILMFRQGIRWKLIFLFGIPGIILSFIGARLLFFVSSFHLTRVLGVFLILYVLFLFAHPAFKIARNKYSSIIGGALSGFFAGSFGLGGAIRSAFLIIYDLPKAVYIATAGTIAFVIDATRIGTYFFQGTHLSMAYVRGFLLFIPASVLGAFLAKQIVDKVPQKWFRSILAAFLFLLSIKLILF